MPALLASRVDQVWRVVDEFATRTHMSYLTERVRMAQEESSIQREFIARLFNQSTPHRRDFRAGRPPPWASGRMPAAASWLPAATPAPVSERPRPSLGAGQRRHRFFVHEFGGNTYRSGRSRHTGTAPGTLFPPR